MLSLGTGPVWWRGVHVLRRRSRNNARTTAELTISKTSMSETVYAVENMRPVTFGTNGQGRSPRVKQVKQPHTSSPGKRRPSRGTAPIPAKSLHFGSPVVQPLGSSPQRGTPRRRTGVWLEKQPSERYAGAKFSSPPHPSALPLPPAHWLEDDTMNEVVYRPAVDNRCMEIERHLRELLKVES